MSWLYTHKITSDYLRIEVTSVSLYSRDVSGFTSHEHLYAFNLININGRNGVYPEWLCYFGNPMVSRMLSPDNYIQAPDFSQSFNRYSYAWNNLLVFTDPDGKIVFTLATLIAAPFTGGTSLALLPIAIGADIGMWQGGSLANGTMNPFKWDYSSKTWGYMLSGTVVGGLSGYVGRAIAASEIPMANTLGIMGASLTNSVGTYAYTGGQTDISMSFGVASCKYQGWTLLRNKSISYAFFIQFLIETNPFYSDFVLLQLDNEIQNKLRAAKYKISFKAIHKQALSLHQYSKSWYIHLILWTISILFIYKLLLQ